ncbi:MAG: hypothetical protein K8R18_16760 [Parvibaculum sp.]|uniref:hypothetical protein n=1 Tax=Parvibaculum sp. TaxID=2024848 RepID=UPI0025DBCB16|nr:hypothetical protein [Parvibaculum sp.]MCE9651273.1 hypothetical protein [Parvibaculum sp.]
MGQAKRRSRSRSEILAGEKRCIYCAAQPHQLEHMPPRAMFRNKNRPSGLEFATCAACNNGTSAADLVASFFARLGPDSSPTDWRMRDIDKWKTAIELKAPGVMKELMRPNKNRTTYSRTPLGTWKPIVEIKADGPLLKGYLTIFCAKMGMALYREHVGSPIPMDGAVFVRWFLGGTLSQISANKIMNVLPSSETLKQGKVHVGDQFIYRFNSDERSIVAALIQFHSGLYVLTIATSEPQKYLHTQILGPTDALLHPGKLQENMPAKGEPYWL